MTVLFDVCIWTASVSAVVAVVVLVVLAIIVHQTEKM